jgi:hypothetical protein
MNNEEWPSAGSNKPPGFTINPRFSMRLFLTLIILYTSLGAKAQHSLASVSRDYYRSDPFKAGFSNFVQHLLNDPTLANKRIIKKSDSTLFYLEADYKFHNPFFFKAVRTRIILAEREDVIVIDSLSYINRVFHYQVIGYTSDGNEGMEDAREEFERFSRRYKKGFTGQQLQELGSMAAPLGAIRDFTYPHLGFFPLTVAWVTTKDHKENFFAITIRFQVENDRAYLPLMGGGKEN